MHVRVTCPTGRGCARTQPQPTAWSPQAGALFTGGHMEHPPTSLGIPVGPHREGSGGAAIRAEFVSCFGPVQLQFSN